MRSFLRALLLRRAPLLFLLALRPTTRELGECGEELAARQLARLGWRLLGRRVATPHGEIDIVAEVAGELVCVEVKAARAAVVDPRGRPGRRLDHRRLGRQRRAGRWLASRMAGGRLAGGRVDLIEVWVPDRSHRFRLEHHRRLSAPLAGSVGTTGRDVGSSPWIDADPGTRGR